jgi:hypothetical protein
VRLFFGAKIPRYPENILFFVIQNRFAGKNRGMNRSSVHQGVIQVEDT